jgi:hypothetical protein
MTKWIRFTLPAAAIMSTVSLVYSVQTFRLHVTEGVKRVLAAYCNRLR